MSWWPIPQPEKPKATMRCVDCKIESMVELSSHPWLCYYCNGKMRPTWHDGQKVTHLPTDDQEVSP